MTVGPLFHVGQRVACHLPADIGNDYFDPQVLAHKQAAGMVDAAGGDLQRFASHGVSLHGQSQHGDDQGAWEVLHMKVSLDDQARLYPYRECGSCLNGNYSHL
ncbi:hypothetical protein CD932_20895 [Janthinobacterium sp. PC23-8]|nr:hypothetical protein CD932_20895 [Janthinobacterium sp. PC23-8]